MNRVVFITIIIALILNNPLYGQMSKETMEDIKDANSYFYFEDYEEALPLYLNALKKQPNNAYLQYHIGFCYLNITGNKHKAIEYLENACRNMTRNYQEDNIHGSSAPYDALFYLGNAYFVNNNIPKALETYKRFREIIGNYRRGQWNINYLDHQVKTASKSRDIQKTPINFLMQNLGGTFNDRFSNFNAVISRDGKTIAFTTKRKFYNAIYISYKKSEGTWTTPQNITLDLEVDGNCTTLSLSSDGSRLYLFKDENHDGNIYISRYNGTKWLPMSKLNKNINTQYYETHASESPDGKYLFFSSNRKGGYGDLDIYISELTAEGDWGPAKNLGNTINTEYNENTPFLSANGELLFFSSEGHRNIGGYDIFMSQNENYSYWTSPINIGFPLNTPDDNLFFCPIDDGSSGLYSAFDEEGFGDLDIYELNLFIPKFMKCMMQSSELSNYIGKTSYNILVVDTISSTGTALIDKTATNFEIEIDHQKPTKLFYNGRCFNVGEKTRYTDIESIESQKLIQEQERQKRLAQKKQEEELDEIESKRLDSINTLIQISNNQNTTSGHTSITDTTFNTYKTTNLFATTNKTNNSSKPYISNYNNNNYLVELLLLLAPSNVQPILTNILKKDWLFNQFSTDKYVFEFANSLKTEEERSAMLTTLTIFLDYIDKNVQGNTFKQSKTISINHNRHDFFSFYNQVINQVSYELAEKLSDVLVNNRHINSFEKLITKFKEQYPNEYNKHSTELIGVIAHQSINHYMSLTDNEKYKLYSKKEHRHEIALTPIYISILLLVLVSLVGIILIKRKRK